jgi:hypothetical protein
LIKDKDEIYHTRVDKYFKEKEIYEDKLQEFIMKNKAAIELERTKLIL